MASCFTRCFAAHKTFLTCSRTSPSKFFSSLSPVYDKVCSSNPDSHKHFCKPNHLKQAQLRYFSFHALSTIYDGIANSDLSHLCKDTLIQTHDFTGMPWWATIISASLALKLFVSLPCGVCQQHISSKIELTKDELNGLVEGIKQKVILDAKRGKWTQQKATKELRLELRRQWKLLVVKNNCHPFKNVVLFITQFPFWLVMTLMIRKFAMDVATMNLDYAVPELQFLVGGPIWCRNLAAPDPTFILPALNAIAILAVSETNTLLNQIKAADKKQGFITKMIIPNILRLLAVAFFFISAVSPSALSLFWATNSVISLVQNLVLLSPRVRKLLRIPPTPSDLSKPYTQMLVAFVNKWRNLLLRK